MAQSLTTQKTKQKSGFQVSTTPALLSLMTVAGVIGFAVSFFSFVERVSI